jgi:hypothetical protein
MRHQRPKSAAQREMLRLFARMEMFMHEQILAMVAPAPGACVENIMSGLISQEEGAGREEAGPKFALQEFYARNLHKKPGFSSIFYARRIRTEFFICFRGFVTIKICRPPHEEAA